MEHKTQCRCFFDARGIAQKAHSWIDEALWVLWRVKVPCPRGIERKKDPSKNNLNPTSTPYPNLLSPPVGSSMHYAKPSSIKTQALSKTMSISCHDSYALC